MEASPDLGQRALIALAELRALLGPNALETEGALDDPSTLEQHAACAHRPDCRAAKRMS